MGTLRLSLDSEPTEPGVRSSPPIRTAWPPDAAARWTPRRSAGVAVSSSVPLPLQPLHDGVERLVEPWGLVANEAMNQHCAVIATDAVGAAAGGLVRDGQTGIVVPAGEATALGAAIRRLHDDPGLRERLAGEGAEAVRAYTYEAWAAGFIAALDGATHRNGC